MFYFLSRYWRHIKIGKSYHNQTSLKIRNFHLVSSSISYNKSIKNAKCSQLTKICLKSTKNLPIPAIHNQQNDNSKKQSHGQINNYQLSADLVDWAISSKITHYNFSTLLKVLKNNGLKDLSTTSRSLLKNKEKQIVMHTVPPGVYVHYGLNNQLKQVIKVLSEKKVLNEKNINIKIFIDNLELNKKFKQKIWVILASVTGFRNAIFTVGAYNGVKNPENSNYFLKNFVDEIKCLCSNGLEIQNKCYDIKVKSIICDAPAKAFILDTKMSYLGYSSCTKCNVKGELYKKKICFPEKAFPKRDEDFNNHKIYKKEKTKLLEIPEFGVVTKIPLDYMHLVCLGVVKKLISTWLTQSTFPNEMIQDYPKEFRNKIKPLKRYSFWSSAQFRQFLLYYGPVVMKDALEENKYQHFLKLHLACRMLCIAEGNERLYSAADSMLNEFVQDFVALYGKECATHNLHGLYHLTDDCRRHGTLDEFSAFPFEKYLARLKSSVVRKKKPGFFQIVLQKSQEKLFERTLAKLKTDRRHLDKKLSEGSSPSYRWKTYEKLKLNNWSVIGGQEGDDYLLLKNRKLIRVLSVWEKIKTKKKSVYLQGVQLSSVSDLYEKPFKSSNVGVFLIGGEEREPKFWPINEVDRKCVKISTAGGQRVLCSMMNEEF